MHPEKWEYGQKCTQFSIHGCQVWRPVGWILLNKGSSSFRFSFWLFNYSSGYVLTQRHSVEALFSFFSDAIMRMQQLLTVLNCFSTVPIKAVCQGCKPFGYVGTLSRQQLGLSDHHNCHLIITLNRRCVCLSSLRNWFHYTNISLYWHCEKRE